MTYLKRVFDTRKNIIIHFWCNSFAKSSRINYRKWIESQLNFFLRKSIELWIFEPFLPRVRTGVGPWTRAWSEWSACHWWWTRAAILKFRHFWRFGNVAMNPVPVFISAPGDSQCVYEQGHRRTNFWNSFQEKFISIDNLWKLLQRLFWTIQIKSVFDDTSCLSKIIRGAMKFPYF